MEPANRFSRLLADVGRSRKPRTDGLTVVIDTGLGRHAIEDLAEICGDFVDRIKIAWASSLITRGLEAKLDLLRRHHIEPLLGGSVFEYAFLWGKLDELLALVRDVRCAIEISDGVATVPRRDKLRWIESFAAHGVVYSEVGGKLSSHDLDWPTCIREEMSAGASYVVVEGREIGPVGNEIRADLIDTILSATDPKRLIFEALERYQQVWLVKRLGPNVNLGNIRAADVLVLETFRQGLKEQTMLQVRERFGR